MRPRKNTSEHLLLQSAHAFKRYGYMGCSMGKLAEACGLSKAAFYYDYPNKDALLMEILNLTHVKLKHSIFQQLQQTTTSPQQAFSHIHQLAIQFFSQGGLGCLVGILSMERQHLPTEIFAKLQSIFQEWQLAFEVFFQRCMSIEHAAQLAKVSLADYEGAILMARITDDLSYLDLVQDRIFLQLAES